MSLEKYLDEHDWEWRRFCLEKGEPLAREIMATIAAWNEKRMPVLQADIDAGNADAGDVTGPYLGALAIVAADVISDCNRGGRRN